MSRSVRAYLVCVAALSLGGCFKHHTVEEGALVPLDDDGDEGDGDGVVGNDDEDDDDQTGDGDAGDGDKDDDDEGEKPGTTLPFCQNPDQAFIKEICDALGGGNQGDGDGDGGGLQIPGIDCKNPADEITKAICQLTGGGSGGTTIPGLQCLRPADELTALLCGVLGGGLTGGIGGGSDLGDLLGVDCDKLEPNDFFGSLLCGGGFGGGGTGTGTGNNNGNNGRPTAAQCKNPANQFIAFLCNLPTQN